MVVEAVALHGGRVLAVGTSEELMALSGDGTVFVDLDGKAVYPGPADAHAHLVGIGRAAVELDLMGTESYAEVLERVAARDAELPEGAWLLAPGYRADLVVFEGDLMTAPLTELQDCRPEMTVFAGQVVWSGLRKD